jgi:hypothetical protein
MQGMGRATRSRSDRAVVFLAGEDLLLFINDPGNTAGMRPELRAELAYGVFLATEWVPLRETVESFLVGGKDWASGCHSCTPPPASPSTAVEQRCAFKPAGPGPKALRPASSAQLWRAGRRTQPSRAPREPASF